MKHLDKIDLALLAALDRDASRSHREISKEIRVAEETLRYRTQRLFEEGVIQSFFTIIDAGKLGNNYFKVLLKLQSTPPSGLS